MNEAVTFRNDYVFKKIFDHHDPFALMFLVNSVLNDHPVSSLFIKNSEHPADKINGKRIYDDIKAQDENGNDIIIEMQDDDINSIQEDRFVFMACKNDGSQLTAGESYDQQKNSQVIIFYGKQYGHCFHTTLRLNDLEAGHSLKHKNVVLHFIVLPMIDQIILEKEKSGEPLTDLEFMSWVLWRGVDDMKYQKANDKQKKIMMVMENRLNSLYSDPQEMTYAKQLYFF